MPPGCGYLPGDFKICYVESRQFSTISFIIRQQKYLNIGILSLENLKVYEVSIKKL